jgi:hypothetical protein
MQTRVFPTATGGLHMDNTGANAVPGVTYCTGGYVSGEKCDKVATGNNVMNCWPDGCTDKLTSFTNGFGTEGGDSGGPFYRRLSSVGFARGIIIGPDPHGTGYAQEWSEIEAVFSVVPCSAQPC